jgi:hypothetical protein
VLASQENRGDKMQLIYSYVTGNEFKQKLEAAFEAFRDMQEDLIKEKPCLPANGPDVKNDCSKPWRTSFRFMVMCAELPGALFRKSAPWRCPI